MNTDTEESKIIYRSIEAGDNLILANIIRRTMEEFKVDRPGTVYDDPMTDHLAEFFQSSAGSYYFVVEMNGEVIGGAGIFPTDQLPEGVCEFVKIYILPHARGKGIAKELIKRCISKAKEFKYHSIYLESFPELKQALKLYEYFGFKYLDKPMGNSQHAVDIWMIKNIEDFNL